MTGMRCEFCCKAEVQLDLGNVLYWPNPEVQRPIACCGETAGEGP
jgi:hypothetical protein